VEELGEEEQPLRHRREEERPLHRRPTDGELFFSRRGRSAARRGEQRREPATPDRLVWRCSGEVPSF
jgi:hypothetical protein